MKENKIIVEKISDLEQQMFQSDFWKNSKKAQEIIIEIERLKIALKGGEKFDKNDALINIHSGAGGDDAEDFTRILFEMYQNFSAKQDFTVFVLDENKNKLNGYRNISFQIFGKNAYKKLKNEAGVHRLVRKSPFNSKKKRQTSFCLVDVLPKIEKKDFEFDETELKITFSKSGGAGGQNVNKRETAVRILHQKTGFSCVVSSERTQERNRELALEMMRAKLFKKHQNDEKILKQGFSISDQVKIEWGNQIRSYVFDPYQIIKDHLQNIEIRNIEKVLKGDLEVFQKEIKE